MCVVAWFLESVGVPQPMRKEPRHAGSGRTVCGTSLMIDPFAWLTFPIERLRKDIFPLCQCHLLRFLLLLASSSFTYLKATGELVLLSAWSPRFKLVGLRISDVGMHSLWHMSISTMRNFDNRL